MTKYISPILMMALAFFVPGIWGVLIAFVAILGILGMSIGNPMLSNRLNKGKAKPTQH